MVLDTGAVKVHLVHNSWNIVNVSHVLFYFISSLSLSYHSNETLLLWWDALLSNLLGAGARSWTFFRQLPNCLFPPAHSPQGATAASCMKSCYTERWGSHVSGYIQYSTQLYNDSNSGQSGGSLSRQVINSFRRCILSTWPPGYMIHAAAHLKAMFLPRPLLCSVFLRLRDRWGMRAWTTEGSKTATVSRVLYTCRS